ncbi:MAG: sugar kinase [Rhodospirillales bacterium]|nr:sugar kinase [Rhodospirillales bacterium]
MEPSPKKRLTAVGAVCHTTVYRVETIPAPPAKILAADACRVVDGMAISAACAFHRLGGEARIWARLGDDAAGAAQRAELAATGVDVSDFRMVAGGRSSHATVVVDARGDRLVVPFHDPSLDRSPDWLPLDRLGQSDFLHVEVRWAEGAEVALAAARRIGLPAMLDGETAPPGVLERLVPLASHAVFSDQGILAYARATDVETALRRVAATHDGHVGASCGADGYAWIENGAVRRVPAPTVDVVDTLSAGDVFHGALALMLAEGRPTEAAARFACVAASIKCTRFGGRLGCPTREEVIAAGG